MVDPEALVEAEIDQSVVASPAIGVKHGFGTDSAANDRLQHGFGGVGHDIGIDLVAAFEQTEDDGLAAGSATAFATHTARAEVRFIGFEHTFKRGTALRDLGHATRILRKIALTDRIEIPAIAAVWVAAKSKAKQRTERRNRASLIFECRKYRLTPIIIEA